VNKCRRQKLSLPRYGSLKLSSRKFQGDEPATEKAREPSVLSRHHGTTKRRQVADRRCYRAEKSDNSMLLVLFIFYTFSGEARLCRRSKKCLSNATSQPACLITWPISIEATWSGAQKMDGKARRYVCQCTCGCFYLRLSGCWSVLVTGGHLVSRPQRRGWP